MQVKQVIIIIRFLIYTTINIISLIRPILPIIIFHQPYDLEATFYIFKYFIIRIKTRSLQAKIVNSFLLICFEFEILLLFQDILLFVYCESVFFFSVDFLSNNYFPSHYIIISPNTKSVLSHNIKMFPSKYITIQLPTLFTLLLTII